MSPALLRASQFCRRPLPSPTYEVQLRVLVEPPPEQQHPETQLSFATLRTLQRISHLSGELVTLSVTDNSQRNSKSVATTATTTTRLVALGQRRVYDDDDDDEDALVIYINSLTAINLGIDRIARNEEVPATAVGSVSTCHKQGLPSSETATLQLLGRPLAAPSLDPPAPRTQLGPSSSQDDDSDDGVLSLPPAGTLLQRHQILLVPHHSDNNGELYFYQVLHVAGGKQQQKDVGRNDSSNNNQQDPVYIGTTTTRYRITSQTTPGLSDSYCPQLPPLWQARLLVRPPSPQHVVALPPPPPPPHPDIWTLVDKWSSWSSSPFSLVTPAERIRHVVATESEHDVTTLIHATADWLGRRCIVVSGLAFYAYWNNNNNNNNTSSRSNTNPTGSLADKLAGLEAALEQAARHAPSIVLIQDMDRELSVQDKPLREDEESRIWSLLMDQLQLSSWNNEYYQEEESEHSSSTALRLVPSVLVVLSSSKPLPPGPLAQGLVYRSITCSLPNEAYVRYLWTKSQNHRVHDDLLLPDVDSVLHLLLGRGAGEIVALRDQLYAELVVAASGGTTTSDEAMMISMLEDFCRQRDEQRRQKKSGAGRIPSVKWDDIGGLAKVRREIMDAIELPLQYPHLFSKSTPRSGMLLYGAPGCGKTLVAKAVATECGLPFFSIKGPELLGSYVGESEAHVREVFEQARQLAKQNKPPACVLFFDELDSLAPRRGETASGGNVMDRVVSTFFTELDKESGDCSVFVIGATNRPDLLDPSLLRPGRFDRLVYLGVSPSDRQHILATQIRKLRLEGDATELAATVVKHLPENLTGADLSTVASGAQLLATERLCAAADAELSRRQNVVVRGENSSNANKNTSERMTIDQLLESWDPDRLTPVVTLEDLLQAAQTVVPSVSATELERYEPMKDQFQR